MPRENGWVLGCWAGGSPLVQCFSSHTVEWYQRIGGRSSWLTPSCVWPANLPLVDAVHVGDQSWGHATWLTALRDCCGLGATVKIYVLTTFGLQIQMSPFPLPLVLPTPPSPQFSGRLKQRQRHNDDLASLKIDTDLKID